MSTVRFNHVFVGLLILSALTAFAISPTYTGRFGNLQGLFAPIATPTRNFASSLREKLSRHEPDRRQMLLLQEENHRLGTSLASVTGQLEELKRVNADRSAVGDLRSLCTPVQVVGADTGTSESLNLRGTTLDGIEQGMPVVYSGGLVGRIARAGVGGSQVQLVTDRGFKVTGHFTRIHAMDDGSAQSIPIETIQALAQGAGRGFVTVNNLPLKEAEQLQVGDLLVLEDPDWPLGVQWQRLGQVVEVTARRDAPLFAQVKVRPVRNLRQLREVMVVTKLSD